MKSMDEITIPETIITDEQYNANARQLAAAIVYQASKDYCSKKATDKTRSAIIKDLRSKRMDAITDGMSPIIAEQLELHPDEIRERIQQQPQEE